MLLHTTRPEASPGQILQTILIGALVLAAGFLVYQISSGVALVVLLLMQGLGLNGLMAAMESGLAHHPYSALAANAVGQGIGLAGVALLAARLTVPRIGPFLRIRRADGPSVLVSVLGVLCLIPLVQALSDVNRLLPIPDWLAEMERSQLVLLEAVLADPGGWFFNLALLAATPALCEELLFRGYFQRRIGRLAGARAAIVLSGLLFAFYHLRPTQIVPLALLGTYLAYVVWRTDSLWTGVVVHFVYNGLLVLTAPYVEGATDPEAGSIFPLYVVLLGVAGFAALMFWLHRHGGRRAHPVSGDREAYPSPSPESSDHER